MAEVSVRVRPEVDEGLGLEGAVVLLVDVELAARRQPCRSDGRRGGAAPLHGVISCIDGAGVGGEA